MKTVVRELVRVDTFDPWQGGSSNATVCLTGILARGSQFDPIRGVLGEYGSVHVVSYLSPDIDAIIDVVCYYIEDLIVAHSKTVTILGASLGGDISLFVIERLRAQLGDEMVEDRISVRLDDAPIGGESMKQLPEFFRKFLLTHPYSPVPNFVGALFLLFMRGLPKDSNIEMPDDTTALAGRRITDIDEFRVWVKAQAKIGLSGHKFSMWWASMSWMCRVGEILPFGTLRGIKVVYARCNGARNDTLKQPVTGDMWLTNVPHVQILEVDTPHCAYLEANAKWLDATITSNGMLGVLRPS